MDPALKTREIGHSMRRFDSDGVELAYLDMGMGDPVLLIHGFGANAVHNWIELGWADRLVTEGRRMIAIDNRGHGESEKLYDPEDYALAHVSEDARRLLDHLDIERADVLGYSMGARIAASLAAGWPSRVRSLVIGGMGRSLFVGLPPAHDVAEALEADSLEHVESEGGRMFRSFVERTEGDRAALAACMRSARAPVDPEELRRLSVPVLVAVGTRDTIAGPLQDMASFLPQAELFDIPGRSHMGAVADPAFIARVLDFLAARP